MRRLQKLTVPLAALMLVTACGDAGTDAASADGGGELNVMLSYKESIYWLPMLVAVDQGFFEDEGLNVSFEETNGSGFVTQQLLAGNVSVGWAGAPDTAVAYSREPDVRALMCSPPQNIFRIIVPEDSEITEIAQLEGRTLGIAEAGGGEEPIVDASLADAGLDRNTNVTVLPIGDAGPASLNAILNGDVDAYAGSYPDISTLTADGRLVSRDITPEQYNDIPGDCMITTVDALEDEEQRAQFVSLARAWAKGAEFAAANPGRATEIACEMVPEECGDAAFAERYTLDTIELSGVGDDGPFGAVDVSAWQTTLDVLAGSGAIEDGLDAEQLGGGDLVAEFVADYSDFDPDEVREAARAQ